MPPDQYEVIGEKVTYRIAQRPAATMTEVPAARWSNSKPRARSSLCRPRRGLGGEPRGCKLRRGALDGQVRLAPAALSPASAPGGRRHPGEPAVAHPTGAGRSSACSRRSTRRSSPRFAASRVKAMDETPIKAGRAGHGKMHTGYFWPVYGEHDEVCFPFHASRSADFVCQALGRSSPSPTRCS